jgi:hypothetical protein
VKPAADLRRSKVSNGPDNDFQMTGIMTVLLQPSLALIDNGHFQ